MSEGGNGKFDVLILDGESRAALAAVRSLGRAGINVVVASAQPLALSFGSRFAKAHSLVPDPRGKSAEYISSILQLVEAYQPKFVLPLTDLSWKLLLPCRDRLPAGVILPGVNEQTFLTVAHKGELLQIAATLGMHVPQTRELHGGELGADDKLAVENFPYPAVLKAESSEQEAGGGMLKAPTRYVQGAAELKALLREENARGIKFLLQQRIAGRGVGVFALCADGDPIAVFCHQRVLEKPPSGGPSVLSESIAESEAPVAESLALLKQLRWDGVAMVEFKQNAAGESYLMEINPRFWGSLQLAVDSGRDFPLLLFKHISGESISVLRESVLPYRIGRRLRWDLGCLDHLLIRLKAEGVSALRDLFVKNSLQLFAKPRVTRHETFRFNDPLPFVYEVIAYGREFLR